MGEFVESNLEKLIPVFEQLANVQLLETLEVQSLVKRCRRYEYRLAKKEKTPSDYIVYGEYLCEVLSLIRSRRARADYWHKMKDIDGAVITKIASLYRCCCDRFQGNLNHWNMLFDFLNKHNRRSTLSKAYGRCLQIHGRNLEIRCRSALWEFFGNASADNARVQLQLALRMYPHEYTLFCTLFKVELGFVNKIIERREFLRRASKEVKKQSEADNTSDIDESVFDEEVDDSILQLMVAKVVVSSALKSVPDRYKGEMLLTMWKDHSSFSSLPSGPAKELKDLLEAQISELGEEHTQLLLIEKDIRQGMDIFEAYDAAVIRLNSEKMYRLYLKMCSGKKNDSLASLKIASLLNVLVDRKWIKSEDMKSLEENIDDILCSGSDRLTILEHAIESNPTSVVFWTELLRYHLEGKQDDKRSLILDTLNSAFDKVPLEESLPVWELAIDYAVAYDPETVEQVFTRAYLTAPASVSSQVKIIHLEYLSALFREQAISDSQRKESVVSLMKNKPNTSEFYIAVADGELARDSQEHKLIKQAFEFAIVENGSSSVDSWVHYGAYCMKHDVCNTSKVYQRALISLLPSLCSHFITEWTKLQQKEATLANEAQTIGLSPDYEVVAKLDPDEKYRNGSLDRENKSPLLPSVVDITTTKAPLENAIPTTPTRKRTKRDSVSSDLSQSPAPTRHQKVNPTDHLDVIHETVTSVCEHQNVTKTENVPETPTRKRTKRDSTSSDVTRSPARTRRQKALALEHPELFAEGDEDV